MFAFVVWFYCGHVCRMLSVAGLLILFDHVLLAVLFLIALFCVVSAVMTSLASSGLQRRQAGGQLEEEGGVAVVERTDTCYSVEHGTSVLFESDLANVV